MKQIQEWLGHSTYVTTADIYSHLDFSSKVNVGKAIGDFFGEVKQPDAPLPDEILDVETIDPDYKSGYTPPDPEIIMECPDSADSNAEPEEPIEENTDDEEFSREEYEEFKRWKRMMKKKDMEM